ncbi:glycosyltransferase family 2 protein [Candidatus Poriferisodalis sp.]|uniref:glycosyltransferase family 2 protein n=1 Tax=Candidatus Poriferisodalis sp. TaxID=3101277 RepID=UPI003B010275
MSDRNGPPVFTPPAHRPTPPPADVRGNDWRSLGVAPLDVFEPLLPVTVVVPYYEAPDALALTLAGLERQTYPADLYEVVVVDDGSDPPLDLAQLDLAALNGTGPSRLSLRVVHQEDLGFGLARARNNGARAAQGDVLIFLDCDMVPEADWLSAHARWHHAASDLLTLGFRHHVDVDGIGASDVRNRPGTLADLFEGRPIQRPEWIERRMEQTDNLASDADDVFRVVTGGNFAVSKAFFETVGCFDESFTQWGSEDIEFGWRAYAQGAVLVPERSALCWHQGEGAVLSEDETVSLAQQRDKLSHLIPDRRLRTSPPGRSYTVPQFVVTVQPGHVDESEMLDTVEQVLASNFHDLVVWVDERPGEQFERLRRQLDPDPRVSVGAAGGAALAHPAAAYHVRVPAGAGIRPRMFDRLQNQLGTAAAGESDLASGHRVGITRGWAIHRARRSHRTVAEFGAVVELDVDSLQVTQEAKPQGWLASKLHGPAKRFLRLWARMRRHGSTLFVAVRRIRRPADVARLIGTVARAVWWRLKNLRWKFRSMMWALRRARKHWPRLIKRIKKRLRIWLGLQPRSQRYVQRLARYPLGAEIVAVGREASAVFAASTRVATHVGDDGDHHVDVVVADSAKAGEAALQGAPSERQPLVAVLADMAPSAKVQAFNPEAVNPIGWSAGFESEPASVRSLLSPARGSIFSLYLGGELLADLRAPHHLTDSAADHRDAVQRAGALAALAGAGIVVHIDAPDPELAATLGPALHDLMASGDITDADAHRREQLSVEMRRCALRDHSLRSRARQILSASGVGAQPPEVSIVAPTRRPDRVADVITTAARQTYPRLELVLALHGDGFDSDTEIEALAGELGQPLQIVRVDGTQNLGGVLRAAAEEAGGSLLTKMDDDDYYGAEHIWDLVLAHEYSRAELIGKSAEYVYLERLNTTVRDQNRQKFSERYIPFVGVSGGVLMISRHDLEAAGGWRRVPRRVDIALAHDITLAGGRIYWTHGAGYLRVRHGDEHTWNVEDSHFLGRASEVRDGCDLSFAGVAEA